MKTLTISDRLNRIDLRSEFAKEVLKGLEPVGEDEEPVEALGETLWRLYLFIYASLKEYSDLNAKTTPDDVEGLQAVMIAGRSLRWAREYFSAGIRLSFFDSPIFLPEDPEFEIRRGVFGDVLVVRKRASSAQSDLLAGSYPGHALF